MPDSAEHTSSYYAATANWATKNPPLDGEARADVCVIGGGFTGINIAIELVERGYSVIVLEARRIGWGASGRNGGQLIGGITEPYRVEKRLGAEAGQVVWKMGQECVEIVRDRILEYDIDCDLKNGFFDAALNKRQMNRLLEWKDAQEARGYRHKLTVVEKEDMRSVVDTDAYVGGIINERDGHLHPLNLCLGEARAAEMLGVEIYEQSPVVRITRRAAPEVRTANGVVHASYIVVACNAYLDGLVPKLNGRIFPAGSYIIATEPLAEEVATRILPQDMAICDQNNVLDYYRLSADRRLLFGGRCNYSGREPKDITKTLRPRMLKLFPELEDARIDYEWGGNIAISLNRIPHLGRIDESLYYSIGYSGHGLAPTHIAARVIAEAIAGDTARLELFEKIRHITLPGGKWFGNQVIASGMLYFRMRDILGI